VEELEIAPYPPCAARMLSCLGLGRNECETRLDAGVQSRRTILRGAGSAHLKPRIQCRKTRLRKARGVNQESPLPSSASSLGEDVESGEEGASCKPSPEEASALGDEVDSKICSRLRLASVSGVVPLLEGTSGVSAGSGTPSSESSEVGDCGGLSGKLASVWLSGSISWKNASRSILRADNPGA
jgi:hypothetical protein